jgi:hypothetical protein
MQTAYRIPTCMGLCVGSCSQRRRGWWVGIVYSRVLHSCTTTSYRQLEMYLYLLCMGHARPVTASLLQVPGALGAECSLHVAVDVLPSSCAVIALRVAHIVRLFDIGYLRLCMRHVRFGGDAVPASSACYKLLGLMQAALTWLTPLMYGSATG